MHENAQVDVFAAIAHPARRRILDLLAGGERPVNEIAGQFAMSRPAVSQHLRALLDAGLLAETRHGRQRRYRLAPGRLAEVSAWLSRYEIFWQDHLQRLGDELDSDSASHHDSDYDDDKDHES
jgi:DNA-binding transcriptional ArsR family regulator